MPTGTSGNEMPAESAVIPAGVTRHLAQKKWGPVPEGFPFDTGPLRAPCAPSWP